MYPEVASGLQVIAKQHRCPGRRAVLDHASGSRSALGVMAAVSGDSRCPAEELLS